MDYPVHLKTGFFKTIICRLSLDEPGINLTPIDPLKEDSVYLPWDSIFEVSFLEWENSIEIDILTSIGTYLCIVDDQEQARMLAHELKEDHKIRIRYQ
jgi:hypothetical protein